MAMQRGVTSRTANTGANSPRCWHLFFANDIGRAAYCGNEIECSACGRCRLHCRQLTGCKPSPDREAE